MLKNYLKTAWRNFIRSKIFSFVNIFGLAIGFTCFLLISAYVYYELSYDRYPVDSKDIYRVNLSVTGNSNTEIYTNVDAAVGEGMKDAFPEVRAYTRISPTTFFIKYNDKQFKETKLAFAASNFLQMFSIPLIEGDIKNALVQPNSIVISKEFAEKYFGNNNPLGKSLIIGLHDKTYKITGVYDKIPDKSHFHFDAFLSFSSLHISKATWSNLGFYTYLLLNKNADPKKLENKFPQLVKKYVVPEVQNDMGISYKNALKAINTFRFSLFPLTDIHLYSHTKYELEPNGDIQYVYIFSILAVFILLLACINFTNLSTARSDKKAREIGVRKVLGSEKFQLIKQLLSESVLLSFFSLIIALLLIIELLPYFNQLAGKHISFNYFINYQVILFIFALVILVGMAAGIYPALFLSSFNPIQVLKGTKTKDRKNLLRSSLIIFQFFVSIGLIFATIIVYKQFVYMQNKKLGFNKDQVLFISDSKLLGNKQSVFKHQLLQDPRVESASICWNVPGYPLMDGTEIYANNNSSRGPEIHSNIYHIDYDFINTLGIYINQGRNFSKDFPTDSAGVIINEAAVRELGWNKINPIGKIIVRSGQKEYKVIGVAEDFNYMSAKQKVAPLMMMLGNNFGGLLIKIKTSDVRGFLKDLRIKWNAFSPAGQLNFSFLNDKFAALYLSEQKTQQIFSTFALIAIIIASLGLFGLSSYVIEQRTKEIGIRKVLGASVSGVVLNLSADFLKWVLIANIIAWPAAYYFMNKWLQNFAYKVDISWWIFVLSGGIAFIVALLTVIFQAVKTATANPVKSLRYE